MTEQKQINRLIVVLETYKAMRRSIDLTETEVDLLIKSLRDRKDLLDREDGMK